MRSRTHPGCRSGNVSSAGAPRPDTRLTRSNIARPRGPIVHDVRDQIGDTSTAPTVISRRVHTTIRTRRMTRFYFRARTRARARAPHPCAYKSPRVPAQISIGLLRPHPHPSSPSMFTSLRLVLLTLSAATSAVVGVGAQGVCARNATVQSLGETCDFISNLFNASTSVQAILRL